MDTSTATSPRAGTTTTLSSGRPSGSREVIKSRTVGHRRKIWEVRSAAASITYEVTDPIAVSTRAVAVATEIEQRHREVV
jgi:hypothetical protein